jgi:hypothetical protein
MAFSKTPIGFFGPGYALTSSAIVLPTVDAADVSIATVTRTANTLVFAAYHNLKVGDKVSLTTTDTLPAPLAPSTDYFVQAASGPSATPHTITLSATKGGAVIPLTDAGTGTHTAHALAPLQLVTDAEAHATTGDWREIIGGIIEMAYQKQQNTAAADRSSAVIFSKSVRALPSDPSVLITTYGVVIKSQNIPGDVVAE